MKIFRFSIPFLFFVALMPDCKATSESDSLEISLQKIPKDTNYVRAVEKYAWKLLHHLEEERKAELLLRKTEALAIKLKDYKGAARINWSLGYLYLRYEKKEPSLKFFQN